MFGVRAILLDEHWFTDSDAWMVPWNWQTMRNETGCVRQMHSWIEFWNCQTICGLLRTSSIGMSYLSMTELQSIGTLALLYSIETFRIETSVNGKHQQRRRKHFNGTTFGMNLVSITIMSLCVNFLCRPGQAGKFKADTSTKLTQSWKCMTPTRNNWPASC